MPEYIGDRVALVQGGRGFRTKYREPPPLSADMLLNVYVRQPHSQDLDRPLCFGLVRGRPCVRVAIKGRVLCWWCERGRE